MTTRATLNLDGLADYLETLAKAGQDVDEMADEALNAGGSVLVGGMRRRAPFEKIRAAIRRTSSKRDGNKHWLYVGVLRGSDPEITRIANVWEFGGRSSPSPKNPQRVPRPGIRAHPFIRPALRSDWRPAREAMITIFQEWVKK